MMNTLKKKFNEAKDQYLKNKGNMNNIFIVSAVIFLLMFTINNKQTSNLRDENQRLKLEVVKDETKLQTMYYIVVRQGQTIDRYKQALIECQQSKVIWTQEKEMKSQRK